MGGMGGWGDAIPLAFKNPSPPLEPKIGDLQQNIFWLNQEKNSIYWWIFLYIFRFRSTSDPGCCCWGGKELLYMGFSKSPCMVLEKSKAEPLCIIFCLFISKAHVWFGHPILILTFSQSVRFWWLVQVVWVHILISFWGVTPSVPLRERGGAHPILKS